jgi:cytochrome c oxidase subunit IV
MTIGAGIFLIAVGAILKFATNIHVQGLSIDTIGVILMIAGAVGLLIGLFQEIVWSRRRVPGEVAGPPVAGPPVEERREVRDPAREAPPRY